MEMLPDGFISSESDYNVDGFIELEFKDAIPRIWYFKDIRTHGWLKSHIQIHGDIVAEGPVMYCIWMDSGRIMFPEFDIKNIHITYNTKKEKSDAE